MSYRLSGLNPLSYLGVEPLSPPQMVVFDDPPTTTDLKGYNLGTLWLNSTNQNIFMLTNVAHNIATWTQIFPSGAGVYSFITDINGPAAFSGTGQLSLAGDGVNTQTLGTVNGVAVQLKPSLQLTGTITLPNINTGSPGTPGVVIASGGGLLSASNGTNGQVLIGGGTGPVWATLTPGANITITNGPNSITIASSGGGGGNLTFVNDVSSATSAGGSINLLGTANQITTTGNGTTTVTLSTPTTFIAPGSIASTTTITSGTTITAGTGLTITTGGITLSSFIEGALVSSSTGVITSVTGTAGYVLTANAPGTAPSFQPGGGGGAGVSSITGTANQITASAATGAVTLSTPAVFIAPGSSAAVTTVTAGTNLVSTAGNLLLPTTSATVGQIQINSNPFAHNYGTHNTFIGQSAGNFTLTTASATDNNALGFSALAALTTGLGNSGFGDVSLNSLTTGDYNMGFGTEALQSLLSGSYNISVGYLSGNSYTGAESSNILFNSAGVLGESNTLRIGSATGTGNGQINASYIYGIYGNAPGGTNAPMFIDNTNKIGVIPPTANGQLLIGAGTGASAWATLTSSDGSVIITNAANTINLQAVSGGPGAGATTFITNISGPAVVSGHNISILGTNVISTSGATANTVTVSVVNSGSPAANQAPILVGTQTTLVPAWGLLTSSGASIAITQTGTTVNIESIGSGAIGTLTGDTGSATGATILIHGGSNINTSASGSTVTINLNNYIVLPFTTSLTNGTITLGTGSFLHAYGNSITSNNTFLGHLAGNYTLTKASSTQNTGIGSGSLGSLTSGANNTGVGTNAASDITTGSDNVCVGSAAGDSITTSSQNVLVGFLAGDNIRTGSGVNTALGYGSLNGVTTGNNNIAIGGSAGSSLSGGNSNNIDIGNIGTSGDSGIIRIGTSGTHTSTYLAGVAGITVSNPVLVQMNSVTGQLGTLTGSASLTVTNLTVTGTLTDSALGNGAVLSNSAGVFSVASPSTAGYVLTSNGPTVAPTFQPSGGGGGGITDAFLYVQQTNAPNVLGALATYTLGSSAALTKIFDRGGTQFSGTTFTAPKTGIWYFNVSMNMNNMATVNWTSCAIISMCIVTPSGSYCLANPSAPGYGGFVGNGDQLTLEYSTLVSLTSSQTVTFTIYLNPDGSQPSTVGVGPSGKNAADVNSTFISGYFVST